ncbi:MAG: GAF domain-containing protein, partial [Dehalococcoidia bacterium]|nr:GAF domain-containing protein [Dehalococcoidia bacterium]
MKSAQAPTMDVGSEPGTERAEAEKWSVTSTELLEEIERDLLSTTRLPNLDGRCGQVAERALKAETSSLLLLDERGRQVVVETGDTGADRRLREMGPASGSGIVRWVALHGKPLIVNNVRDDPRFNRDVEQTGGHVVRSAICVPLVLQGKTVGALEVLNRLDGREFATDDLQLLVSIASTT